jgi:hypothetical protein
LEIVKCIIAGSRYITDYALVELAVHESGLLTRHNSGEIELQIVSGMAKGVDSLGVFFANNHNLVLHKFPADWKKNGKRAGPLRNIEMGDFANRAVIIWDQVSSVKCQVSKGTGHMYEYATKKGLNPHLHLVDPPSPDEIKETPKPRKGL